MKNKDGKQGLPGNGHPMELSAQKPADARPRPMPPVPVKLSNYLPSFLEVGFQPSCCSNTALCANIGGRTEFKTDFKVEREYYGMNRLEVGLRSGTLELALKTLRLNKSEPKMIIPPAIQITTETKKLRGAKFSVKDPGLERQRTRGQTFTDTFSTVSKGGTPGMPHWFIKAPGDKLLEGIVEKLICSVFPDEHIHCGCEWKFIAKYGDWSYNIDLHPKLSRSKEFFSKLILRRRGARCIALWNYHVTETLNNILASGGWKCPSKKVIVPHEQH